MKKDHYWGDEDFDFIRFGKAMDYFSDICVYIGRMPLMYKEKYGSMRLEGQLFTPSIIQVFDRGYCSYRGQSWNTRIKVPNWLQKIERSLSGVVMPHFWKYQKFILNIASVLVYRKYPEYKDELFWEYEFKELLYSWVKRRIKYKCGWTEYKLPKKRKTR